MLRKKILSIVSAAAMAATVAVGGSVSAKDMGSTVHIRKERLWRLFSRATAWVMSPLNLITNMYQLSKRLRKPSEYWHSTANGAAGTKRLSDRIIRL